ncbi:MAG: citrate transporter [Eubacteriales bacterium]|nr:citrate transporter [Eubacteriales bacterium]
MLISRKRFPEIRGFFVKNNPFFTFVKNNFMTCAAFLLALTSCFFVPIDEAYAGYFDLRTVACLFCTLAVVGAFKDIDLFRILAQYIIRRCRSTRRCILALVLITYFSSMLLANDMALLTFLPLGFHVLNTGEKNGYMAFTFTMQSIAANLGGMLTPFGNPQNLYLYSRFAIPDGEFLGTMWAPFGLATALILACCLLIHDEPMITDETVRTVDKPRAAAYGSLFLVAILAVMRVLPSYVSLGVIVVALLFLDRKALAHVDYPLLLTFLFFFVFAGNAARIPAVSEFAGSLMARSPLLVSVLSCQIISNVPSAVLLSHFTTDYAPLLMGVNIGGVGTLISSLASLITFREFLRHNPRHAWRYLAIFSLFNFGFMIVLTLFCAFIL